LMGFGYHRGLHEGQLLIVDAASLQSVATVHLPQRGARGRARQLGCGRAPLEQISAPCWPDVTEPDKVSSAMTSALQ
jgi:hypothetical protein